MPDLSPLEVELLAHRWLYYVECNSIISDHEYDRIERRFHAETGRDFVDVHGVGSSLASSYPEAVRERAREMIMHPETLIRG